MIYLHIGAGAGDKDPSKNFDSLDYPAKPRWPLDENAIFLKGAGIKF